jgi:hypothetical protein
MKGARLGTELGKNLKTQQICFTYLGFSILDLRVFGFLIQKVCFNFFSKIFLRLFICIFYEVLVKINNMNN